MDELRADHLQEFVNLQKQYDELQAEYSKLRGLICCILLNLFNIKILVAMKFLNPMMFLNP